MGVSIHYSLRRRAPLTAPEKRLVSGLVRRGRLHLRASPEAPLVLEGTQKLSTMSVGQAWLRIVDCCAALSELRRGIPGGRWHVSVDDHVVRWNPRTRAYDPAL